MEIEVSKINNIALKEANVRIESDLFREKAIALKLNGDSEAIKQACMEDSDFKRYFDDFSPIFDSLKEDKVNREPITIVALTETEKATAKTDADYGVISGHTRLAIAKALNWDKIEGSISKISDRNAIRVLAASSNMSGTSMTDNEKIAVVLTLKAQPELDEDGNIKKYSRDSKEHKKGDIRYNSNTTISRKLAVSESTIRLWLRQHEAEELKKALAKAKEEGKIDESALEEEKEITYYEDMGKAIVPTAAGKELFDSYSKVIETNVFEHADKALELYDIAGKFAEAGKQLRALLQADDNVKEELTERRRKSLQAARDKKAATLKVIQPEKVVEKAAPITKIPTAKKTTTKKSTKKTKLDKAE